MATTKPTIALGKWVPSHYKDRLSWYPYTGKKTSLYWDRCQHPLPLVVVFWNLALCWFIVLTHCGRDKMDATSHTTFSSAFSWMKMHEFRLNLHWSFSRKGLINNIPALVQIMAWCRPGDKPLSEAMMVNLPTHICVSRPQWVNRKHLFLHVSSVPMCIQCPIGDNISRSLFHVNLINITQVILFRPPWWHWYSHYANFYYQK